MLVQTLNHLQLQYVLLIENLDDKSVKKKKSILDKMILQWNIAVKLEHAVFILNKNTIEKKKQKKNTLSSNFWDFIITAP